MTKMEDRISEEHFTKLQQRLAVAGSEISH